MVLVHKILLGWQCACLHFPALFLSDISPIGRRRSIHGTFRLRLCQPIYYKKRSLYLRSCSCQSSYYKTDLPQRVRSRIWDLALSWILKFHWRIYILHPRTSCTRSFGFYTLLGSAVLCKILHPRSSSWLIFQSLFLHLVAVWCWRCGGDGGDVIYSRWCSLVNAKCWAVLCTRIFHYLPKLMWAMMRYDAVRKHHIYVVTGEVNKWIVESTYIYPTTTGSHIHTVCAWHS